MSADPASAVCLTLPHTEANGPTHMARDEALLDFVAERPGVSVFRTYRWVEPTLSLGYFQSIAEAESDPRWSGVPLVRRPTGGGAIWHDRELTYALIVPRDHPLARRSAELYRAVHGAIAAVLIESGYDIRRRGAVDGENSTGPRPFLCFQDRDPEDLVLGRTSKVVGSAQRRRAGAVLQHGSVLLARSPRTPELPGFAELTGVPADIPRWAQTFQEQIPGKLGLDADPSPWPEDVLARASTIEAQVYRNPSWTSRR